MIIIDEQFAAGEKNSKILLVKWLSNMLTVDFKEIARRENLEPFLKNLF